MSGRRESASEETRGWLNFGRSEVMRLEKVAGPVMWRVRVCLVVVVRCLRARVEIREACMIVVVWIAQKDWERESNDVRGEKRWEGILSCYEENQ